MKELKPQGDLFAPNSELSGNAEDELDQCIRLLAHDLLAPVRHLSNLSQLIVDEEGDRLSDRGKEYLSLLSESAQRLRGRIRDISTYCQIGSTKPRMQLVSTKEVVEVVLRDLGKEIVGHNARLTVDLLPNVLGDSSLLSCLFRNLLGNALNFRGASAPSISISAKEGSVFWQFCVADNGVGIEPEHMNKVFRAFQKSPSDRSGTDDSSGMELSLCRRIVENHGGEIWLRSEKGAGCSFFFTLPKEKTGSLGD